MKYILLLITSFIWGCSFMLMKVASASLDSIAIGMGRMTTGALFLWVILLLRKEPLRHAMPLLLPLAGVGLVGQLYPFCIQPYLIDKYSSGFIGMAVALVPIMTILISIPMLKKVPHRFEWIGVTGGLVFTMGLIWDGRARSISLPDLLIWLSIPLTYSLANVYVKKHFQNISPILAIAIPMTICGFLLLPYTCMRSTISDPVQLTQSLWATLILGCFCTGLAGALFYELIYMAGPIFAGLVGYIIPLVALFWAYILDEKITPLQIVSLIGILAMVSLAGRSPHDTDAAEPTPHAK
jgi:drug/metabolite transporter (DMT)-like permease